ncbi:NAD(P)/FAD-dependent oxidoreductase [Paenibacillus psychroresistens]|uniref:NAD(P)/FAD-dependent oxidoreductase n=1 Tax=Paenibacillus psychroresistens TaxID=1778678 RepID=A0A6B8RS81_9BACL|nr:NAD(P)/FAD-dependent oxidoreductase [Paenibacillus psychroresistens]QGQ98098.1 NAD(P)/FAD-dependent oxidoreductase [Paenibacillus psychroresistens]
MDYECIIIGGGIAGLQAAIQLGRYEHHVLIIDKGYGRSTVCQCYHNLLGWPDGISGMELRRLGREHAAKYGVNFVEAEVDIVEKTANGFVVKVMQDISQEHTCRTLLLATGVMEQFPPFSGLVPCLGLTVYTCPDCDSFEIINRKTIVMGSGEVGAAMAITLLSRTDAITYINHDKRPLQPKTMDKLLAKGIIYIAEPIETLLTAGEGQFIGVTLITGQEIHGERAFIAFGGNQVNTALAKQLGIERLENKHIVTDPRSKMTSVRNVWAAGDNAVHSELVSVAMGEGSQSAIWIHKALQEMENLSL